MPAPARNAELNALRRLASAARAFVFGQADRAALADAVRMWDRERDALSQLAFASPTGRRHRGGRGGSALQSRSDHPTTAQDPPTDGAPASRSEASTAARVTWLTPYADAFARAYGEPPSAVAIKRMARTCRDLEIQQPRDEVLRRFVIYLAATPARFYSIEHFGNSFQAWRTAGQPAGGTAHDPLPEEDVDAYIARLARQ